jgi:hypothetical protein
VLVEAGGFEAEGWQVRDGVGSEAVGDGRLGGGVAEDCGERFETRRVSAIGDDVREGADVGLTGEEVCRRSPESAEI